MKAAYALGSKFKACCCIPQRILLGIMTSLSILCSYTMRVCLSMGIVEMVVRPNVTEKTYSESPCPATSNGTLAPITNPDTLYEWDEYIQGWILSSFYWGYIITQIPAGVLSEVIGGKHVLGVGMFLNTFCTLIFPASVIWTEGNVAVVIFLRFVMGLGQGVIYPACTALLAQWVPPKEKSAISSFTFAGAMLGTVFTNSVSGVLIAETKRWESIFYFFGAISLVWNILWQLFCYSYPKTHPCLEDKEKDYLDKELGENVSKKKLKTPWKSILTSIPMWVLVIVEVGHDWGWFVMITDLPKYMNSVLRFEIRENGFYSSFPYFVMWLSCIAFGSFADFLIQRNYLSIKWTRLIFGTLGTMGPAVFMVLASYVGCDKVLAVTMFSLSLFFMGFFYSGIKVNVLDLSPNFAGTVMGFVNGLGIVAGMVAPALVGIMAPNQTMKEWRNVFWLAFAIFAVTNVLFLIFMSAEVQPWNNPIEEED